MTWHRLISLFLLAVFLANASTAVAQIKISKPTKAEDMDFGQRMRSAIKLAKKKNKRVLIVTAYQKKAELKPWTQFLRKHRSVSSLLFNEYEVVSVVADDISPTDQILYLGFGRGGLSDLPVLLVLDSNEKRIGHFPFSKFIPNKSSDKLIQFLEEKKVKLPKAQDVLDQALARAKKENKRVFIHLGAPW